MQNLRIPTITTETTDTESVTDTSTSTITITSTTRDVIYYDDMIQNLTAYDRFDWQRAQPNDETLYWFFVWQAVLNGIAIVFTSLLLCAMIRSVKVRSVSFNWYVFFVTFSDFIASVLCCWTCAASAARGHGTSQYGEYYSEWMCGFQSAYLNFNFTSNCWLNACMMYDLSNPQTTHIIKYP